MSGSRSSGSDSSNPKPPIPAEEFFTAAMEAGERSELPETIMTSDEETESSSNRETQDLSEGNIAEGGIPPGGPPPPVLYKACYFNKDSEVIFTEESQEPIVFQNTLSAFNKAVVEVITDVETIESFSKISSNAEEEEEPQTAVTILGTRLKINSAAIITALQSVIEYYPDHCISEDSNTVWEPYAPLFHHEEELKAYRDCFHPSTIHSEEELCQRNANTYEHLGILQDVLYERLGREVKAERQRHARGMATFEMLWLLFRPGTDVYSDICDVGSYDAYVIRSVSGGRFGRALEIRMWHMDYNGLCLGRRLKIWHLSAYDGEKEISSFDVFPCQYWEQKSGKKNYSGPLKEMLEARGKMFFKLTRRQCMDYDGDTRTDDTKYYKGLTMVDSTLFYGEEGLSDRPDLNEVGDFAPHGASPCLCHVCLKSKQRGVRKRTSRYSSYHAIYPVETESLTDHQYLLCPAAVWAYAFNTRTWEWLDVRFFSDPRFDIGMIDTLVIKDERRRLIKALAQNHQDTAESSTSHKPWAADFVAGKGEGKIFLLHGKPGVGKTYTAECIAAYTKRPLLSLAISDIGTEPSDAERNLNRYFTRAQLWNAILLIDEADIYMERRESQDLTRNSLVSSFLRATERCQSILFLTTNRIGSFDDAFVSRIHVSLYYPDFSEEDRRKVWRIFFDKLARDRKNIMHIPAETMFYATEPEVTSLKWNGREIRNAFQTAVALADFDGPDEDGKIVLRKSHLQQIVRMSQEFQDYLKELHHGNEAKRAERQRIRYDEYGATS